jgi:hypothetical protein
MSIRYADPEAGGAPDPDAPKPEQEPDQAPAETTKESIE